MKVQQINGSVVVNTIMVFTGDKKSVNTIYTRIKRGMSVEAALNKPLNKQNAKHAIWGMEKTYKEWSDYFGVNYQSLMSRINTRKQTLAFALAELSGE